MDLEPEKSIFKKYYINLYAYNVSHLLVKLQ